MVQSVTHTDTCAMALCCEISIKRKAPCRMLGMWREVLETKELMLLKVHNETKPVQAHFFTKCAGATSPAFAGVARPRCLAFITSLPLRPLLACAFRHQEHCWRLKVKQSYCFNCLHTGLHTFYTEYIFLSPQPKRARLREPFAKWTSDQGHQKCLYLTY